MQTSWYKWTDRKKITLKNQPAVYFIAISDVDLSGQTFSLLPEIVYIGMTISRSGLNGRLNQFEKAIKGSNNVHGGAERVRFKHKNADFLSKKTYVSAYLFPLSVKRDTANDWRIKAACVAKEYSSFADYIDLFGVLPEFNDAKRSPKK